MPKQKYELNLTKSDMHIDFIECDLHFQRICARILKYCQLNMNPVYNVMYCLCLLTLLKHNTDENFHLLPPPHFLYATRLIVNQSQHKF